MRDAFPLRGADAVEPPVFVDDFWPRAIGIPMFGIGIPLVFGLYGTLGPSSPMFWLGQTLFLGLAFALWHGNRHLLFTTADRFDWLERPWRRVGRLLLGIVLFTAPLTVAVLAAWSRIRGDLGLDVAAIRAVALTNVICVVFVTHVYETVLLLKQREADLVRMAQTERARAESELLALRRQVDPHFLFNCLNTMQSLLLEDRDRALRFNANLAAMLRYLLETSERHLVPLADELAFVDRYAQLSALRFGDAFRLELITHDDVPRGQLPPTSVQLLIENALAHNRLSSREPLEIRLEVSNDAVIVSHARRPRPDSRGAGVGLKNLAERLRLASNARLTIEDDADRFSVRVPLVAETFGDPASRSPR